jgi:hypothetical protein
MITNETSYPDEECMSDGLLPDGRNEDGSETLPMTKEAQESYDALSSFFANARIH